MTGFKFLQHYTSAYEALEFVRKFYPWRELPENARETLKPGDIFTMASVNAINPEYR